MRCIFKYCNESWLIANSTEFHTCSIEIFDILELTWKPNFKFTIYRSLGVNSPNKNYFQRRGGGERGSDVFKKIYTLAIYAHYVEKLTFLTWDLVYVMIAWRNLFLWGEFDFHKHFAIPGSCFKKIYHFFDTWLLSLLILSWNLQIITAPPPLPFPKPFSFPSGLLCCN